MLNRVDAKTVPIVAMTADAYNKDVQKSLGRRLRGDQNGSRKIFDALQHTSIYIVDRETMITYYENPIAQQYSVKERIGKPCYSSHGNTSMCSSCPIRTQEHVSFVSRGDLNMVLLSTRCGNHLEWTSFLSDFCCRNRWICHT